MDLTTPPDVLVLGGGGIIGDAWMSAVLASLEDAGGFDARESGAFIGTSAGSIVAAALAGGVSARERLGRRAADLRAAAEEAAPRPAEHWAVRTAGAALGGVASPVAALSLRAGGGIGALARRAALSRAPRGRRTLDEMEQMIDDIGVSWDDDRLRVVAVDLRSGRRVVFGAPGSPRPPVGRAVHASCAIPGVFAPVEIEGREYVDGGAWSPTSIDTADVRRGARALCLNPTGSLRPTRGSPLGVLGPVSRAIAATEALSLRHRGVEVHVVSPDAHAAQAMGTNFMAPERRRETIVAGLDQGARLAMA